MKLTKELYFETLHNPSKNISCFLQNQPARNRYQDTTQKHSKRLLEEWNRSTGKLEAIK